jgi:glycosyltransferase involved in cell wall biosynthesis
MAISQQIPRQRCIDSSVSSHDQIMRILCMIPAMRAPGGAERTMSYLVAHLAEREHEVSLLTLERPDASSFYPLPGSVEVIRIDKLGGWGINRAFRVLSRPYRMRNEIRARTPDVIVSFMDTMNVAAILSCVGRSIPVIVSERNDPALHRIGRAKELLRNSLYTKASLVVVQTERVARYFSESLLSKLRIIANPVPVAPAQARPDQFNKSGRLRLIAIGRLEPHKNFDRLIESFARLALQQPNWDLRILGEGPERRKLTSLVRSLGLDSRVELPGLVQDVWSDLAASHLIAAPSSYEGFPNALAEGLSAGLPAIGRKGVSGVEDLIVDGKTGFLVEDGLDPLTDALSTLMSGAKMRSEFGEAARKHVLRWSPAHILGVWEATLSEVASARCDARGANHHQ